MKMPLCHIAVTLNYSTLPAEPRTLTHLCKSERQRPSPALCQREGLGRECLYECCICTRQMLKKRRHLRMEMTPCHIAVTLNYSTLPAEPRTFTHLCKSERQRPSPALCQREGVGRECQYECCIYTRQMLKKGGSKAALSYRCNAQLLNLAC